MTVEAKFRETGNGGRIAAMLISALVGGGGHAAWDKVSSDGQCRVSVADPIIAELKTEVRNLDTRVRTGEISSAGIASDIGAIKSSVTHLESILVQRASR